VTRGVLVGVAVRSDEADERIGDTVATEREGFLCGALERDDRQMLPLGEIAGVEIQLDPRQRG
jgi:hypothetical protein